MAALHLPVPTTLFATLQTSLASVTSMMTTLAIARWAARYGLIIHPLVLTQLLRHPEILAPASYSNFDQRARVALKGATR